MGGDKIIKNINRKLLIYLISALPVAIYCIYFNLVLAPKRALEYVVPTAFFYVLIAKPFLYFCLGAILSHLIIKNNFTGKLKKLPLISLILGITLITIYIVLMLFNVEIFKTILIYWNAYYISYILMGVLIDIGIKPYKIVGDAN